MAELSPAGFETLQNALNAAQAVRDLEQRTAAQVNRRRQQRDARRAELHARREQRGLTTGISAMGWRQRRDSPLVRTDLWVGGEGPPEQLPHPGQEHHKCGLCRMVKSHPVSYICGHSHCYVCIRVWLERQWTCPECVAPMSRPPFCHEGEEASITCEYPEWKDESIVNYSWTGLVFPTEAQVLVPSTP